MEWHLEGNVIVIDAFTVRDSDAQRWADLMAVRVEIPEEIVVIPMDATLIEQVLINLMEKHIFIPKCFFKTTSLNHRFN